MLDGVVPDAAWDWVADTDSLNRLVGIPRVDSRLLDARYGNTRATVRSKGFLPLAWDEGPYEFVRPRKFQVYRAFHGGPAATYVFGAELEPVSRPAGESTRVRLWVEIAARRRWLRGPVRAVTRFQLRGMARTLDAAARASRATGRAFYAANSAGFAPGGAERLREGLERISSIEPGVATRLRTLLAGGPDVDVLRMRPFELADQWGLPRLAVLRLFLHAARAGLVDLMWDVNCPHCRMPVTRNTDLGQLEEQGACPSCDLRYASSFDTMVEVSFAVHPGIRTVEPVVFCMGAPARRRGVLFQQVLEPGERRSLTIELPVGDYVVMRGDSENRIALQVADGPREVAVRVNELGVRADAAAGASGSNATAAPGVVRFELVNELASPARVGLALATSSHDAASAAMVTACQEFRDLFSTEVLKEGVRLGVSSVTLLFTDLKGSTQLYEKFGDAPVYARVRDHFEVLLEAVRAEGGALVKTIGDAVMAAFPSPAAGLRAALAMQRGLAALNDRRGEPRLVVRIGLHAGPCLVINANDRLDYFGSTVNYAARIEGKAEGGQVVITETVAGDAEVASMLRAGSLRASRFEAELKGVSGTHWLTRIEPDSAGASAA